MRRRHLNTVRGGGFDNRGEGVRMVHRYGRRLPQTKAPRVEGLPKDGGARPWAADELTVVAHQAKAVEEEGTQITLSSLY